MECLLPYLSMVTVPHIMVGLERMLDYRGVGLERFHCFLQTIQQFSAVSATGAYSLLQDSSELSNHFERKLLG